MFFDKHHPVCRGQWIPLITDSSKCWVSDHVPLQGGYVLNLVNGHREYLHRRVYKAYKGPIPEGSQLDHLCRNRRCFNPKHLEVVTPRENTLRGFSPLAMKAKQTHCKRGLELIPKNLVSRQLKRGMRECRICKNFKKREKRLCNP